MFLAVVNPVFARRQSFSDDAVEYEVVARKIPQQELFLSDLLIEVNFRPAMPGNDILLCSGGCFLALNK